MDLLIICSLGYLAVTSIPALWRRFKQRRLDTAWQERMAAQQKLAEDRLRAARYAEEERQRQANRLMQQALLQLDQAPDFRRAAQCAQRAAAVPVAFRQRQFGRFRPRLVQFFASRLAAGVDAAALSPGLAELVAALGVDRFEADYIQTEAEQCVAQAASRPERDFAAELTTLQREHERRKEALAGLANVSPELREQLDEAEEARFREAMFDLQGDRHVEAAQPVAPEDAP